MTEDRQGRRREDAGTGDGASTPGSGEDTRAGDGAPTPGSGEDTRAMELPGGRAGDGAPTPGSGEDTRAMELPGEDTRAGGGAPTPEPGEVTSDSGEDTRAMELPGGRAGDGAPTPGPGEDTRAMELPGGRAGDGTPTPGPGEDMTVMELPDAETATAPLPFARPDSGSLGNRPAPREPSATAAAALDRGSGRDGTAAPPGPRIGPRADSRPSRSGRRRTRLGLTRVDPWSVFVLSLIVSLFLGVVLLVAVAVLHTLLDGLGVLSSVDTLAQELDLVGEGQALFGLSRVLGLTAVIAAVDIVLLTVLATLGAYLYNLCAALTGGVEVTLSERD